jgi:hypothetical protein
MLHTYAIVLFKHRTLTYNIYLALKEWSNVISQFKKFFRLVAYNLIGLEDRCIDIEQYLNFFALQTSFDKL